MSVIMSLSVMGRIGRHGFPAARVSGGTERLTTLPADCHSRQYDGVGAYPDIASDSDRPGRHDAGIPLRGVQGMGYCVDAYVWPDEYIVADGDESLVEDCQIEVADEIMAYGYVEPEVASER